MKQTISGLSARSRKLCVMTGLGLGAMLMASRPMPAWAGEVITEDTVAQRLATAKTVQDHEELAAYFRSRAAAMAAEATRHADTGTSAHWVWGVSAPPAGNRCQTMIDQARQAFDLLARENDKLAKQAGDSQWHQAKAPGCGPRVD